MMHKLFVPGKITIGPIDSGSWGSGGKGKMSDYIANIYDPYFAISHNSFNASHITVFDDGSSYKFNALPSSVSNQKTKIVMGADACVQLPNLLKEIEDWKLTPDRLFIHPNMSIITDEQIAWEEENLGSIGSTMSGVGAAKGYKVMRHAGTLTADKIPELRPFISNVHKLVIGWLAKGHYGLLETAQGFDLSMDLIFDGLEGVDKFYPACTSRNISPSSFAGMSFIPPQLIGPTLLNLRTFPIRVGDSSNARGSIILKFTDGAEQSYKEEDVIKVGNNDIRADEFVLKSSSFKGQTIDGKQFKCVVKLGSSGKFYPDQKELSWDEVSKIAGLEVKEQTSLTKRVRRVATRSSLQLKTATMTCMPSFITINFANYLDPNIQQIAGKEISMITLNAEFPKVGEFVEWVLNEQYWKTGATMAKVAFLGVGPKRSDIVTLV